MNIAECLGLAVAAAIANQAMGRQHSSVGKAAYAIDGGSVILQVCGTRSTGQACEAGAVDEQRLWRLRREVVDISDELGNAVLPVRLVPSVGSKIKAALRSVVSGFEHPLVRPAAVVASGVLSFAFAASMLSGAEMVESARIPVNSARAVQCTAYGGDILLADVTDPASHHAFRRMREGSMLFHANVPSVHSNIAGGEHTNSSGGGDPDINGGEVIDEHGTEPDGQNTGYTDSTGADGANDPVGG